MTREEKQKAIDALKISAPVMAVTQEEFKDYIHTLNQVMDWLEQEPFINKPCVSSGVCDHDKNEVLDKIRAEIEQLTSRYTISRERGGMGQVEWSDMLIKESEVLEIIDKYKSESEPQESIEKGLIPYLMHKQMGIPLLECQKAYDIAIDYLRSQGKLKG